MAKTRIGINGFGRMGRLALRAGGYFPELYVVHLNETGGDGVVSAHLMEFDSVHGKWRRDIRGEADKVIIEGKTLGTKQITGRLGFGHALLAERNVHPTGEAILTVPLALTVSEKNELFHRI